MLDTTGSWPTPEWLADADEIVRDAQRCLTNGWVLDQAFRPASESFGGQKLQYGDSDLLTGWKLGDRLILCFAEFASFEIDLPQKKCRIRTSNGITADTLRHLVFDQVLPRLLAHEGKLVLHAAAIRIPAGAILFVGTSGRGKSTLAASFPNSASELLGDDAIVLGRGSGSFECEATYPSLRLNPDSLAAAFETAPATVAVAQYTMKRSVQGLSRPAVERSPVAAIFVVDDADGNQVSVDRMRISEACMALVEQSFALDPTDTRGAQRRLHLASEVASAIPTYRLTYPHDYSLLPLVRERVLDAVAGSR